MEAAKDAGLSLGCPAAAGVDPPAAKSGGARDLRVKLRLMEAGGAVGVPEVLAESQWKLLQLQWALVALCG